jgi:AcrR family transcriptional regulator
MGSRRTDRKTQILLEATRLFSVDGYDKVTVKHLAEAVGISEPALYRHFSSKEQVYDAVLESIESRLDTETLFERLKEEDNLETLLRQLAEHIISFFVENEDLYRLLLFSALSGHGRAREVYQLVRGSYVKFLTKQLDRLHKKKIIIKKRNDITARCFTGMVFECALGMTLWRGFHTREYMPEELMTNNIPIYVRGLEA